MASTIQKMGSAIIKSRGSKFSGYIVPVSEVNQFKELLSNYRHLYPDACHVCSAYRIYIDGRIDEHSSDDGEPRGTSGLPMLNILKSVSSIYQRKPCIYKTPLLIPKVLSK